MIIECPVPPDMSVTAQVEAPGVTRSPSMDWKPRKHGARAIEKAPQWTGKRATERFGTENVLHGKGLPYS